MAARADNAIHLGHLIERRVPKDLIQSVTGLQRSHARSEPQAVNGAAAQHADEAQTRSVNLFGLFCGGGGQDVRTSQPLGAGGAEPGRFQQAEQMLSGFGREAPVRA